MIRAKVLSETTIKTEFKHREWHIVPDAVNPNRFNLETAMGSIICTLAFPESCNTSFLNLIASAPELEDIAEMYQESMTGSRAEKSMIFDIVRNVLSRLQ